MILVEHLDCGNDKEIVFRTKGNNDFTAGELKTIFNQLPEEFMDAGVVLHECVHDGKVRTILLKNKKILPRAGELDFDNRLYTVHIFGSAIFRGGTTTDAYTLES